MEPDERLFYTFRKRGTPVQELAFALATGIAVLDAVKASGDVPEEDFRKLSEGSAFLSTRASVLSPRCARCAFVDLGTKSPWSVMAWRTKNTAASAMACR